MKPTVYIETTIVSYLMAWPSKDVVRSAQQQITSSWWSAASARFDLVTSQLVIIEASEVDPTAAADRINALAHIPVLEISETASRIADALVVAGAIPSVAARDALHVGICAANGINFLVPWNFKHLANAILRDRIVEVCEGNGFAAPVICTPEELQEEPP